ncbi:uncharacterized protein N0V89_007956 [Didymosphaeria variabile]|uniref:Uncharacterized protein n=1 Tax=Didymosphaeria variabile TaxID=1932322 RepID=A0A9W9C8X4_9PLEO|nr:uncharacterized protein N0V89_007956 [Didymosphaeria variabile]KAJ4349342.1 hypothetical protein N0V89_007956 [Didymosphaeria variabile]
MTKLCTGPFTSTARLGTHKATPPLNKITLKTEPPIITLLINISSSRPINSQVQSMAPQNRHHNLLRQIEYRSFVKTIEIYHFPHHLFSVSQFEALCNTTVPGFVRRLESTDTLCNYNGSEKNLVPDGDDVPIGFTEETYLWNVFRDQGSALGFRLLDEDRIEWVLFDALIDDVLSNATVDNGVPMFDHVAVLECGDSSRSWKGTVMGNLEHRDWYRGLAAAERPILPLGRVEANRAAHDRIKTHRAQAAQAAQKADANSRESSE